MSEQDDRTGAKLLRGIVAGVVAGVAASFAMDRFQAAVAALSPPDDSDEEAATARAADAIVAATTGGEVPQADKPLAGQIVHYAVGIGLGTLYGTAFAFGTATLLDEAAVPAVGLGEAPWKSDPSTHLYSYASHLVFGGVSEFVRRQVAGTLTK